VFNEVVQEGNRMYTSVTLLALAGYLAPIGMVPSPSSPWLNDYSLAARQGREQKRPLAVFMAPGPEGWNKLSKEGNLDKDVRQVLETKYVCVHIDTSQESGKRLAAQFEIPGDRGLVLSDVSGEKQAFWHAGALSNADLDRYLTKYGDPDRVARTTETVAEQRAVVSPASYPISPQPGYSSPVVPSFGGGRGNC
jgi:hypothetical protein